ncbi:MAG: hypothetical protein ACXAEF_10685 [Candidatus Thorarchaeota archaeon]|jgi:hypothetical protein
MIRNLIILDSAGRDLLAVNFGECHSMGGSPALISSFVSAIYSFSQSAIGQGIKNIKFENLYFMILNINEIIFLISADDEDVQTNRVKLQRIAEMFFDRYKKEMRDFEANSIAPDFTEFTKHLLDLRITQENCGGRSECEGCPNHRVLPLEEISDAFRRNA